MRVISSFYNVIRKLNRARRNASRLRRLKSEDLFSPLQKTIPNKPERVLLLVSDRGWGNSLFTAGLAKRLNSLGINCAVAVPEEILGHYEINQAFTKVFSYTQQLCYQNYDPDVIVDLSYMSMHCWHERASLIRDYSAPAISLNPLTSGLNLFCKTLNLRVRAHESERMAIVLSQLTGKEESPVFPAVPMTEADEAYGLKFISKLTQGAPVQVAYINACAGDEDRQLTSKQLRALANGVLSNGWDLVIVHPSETVMLPTSSDIIQLPPVTFGQLCGIMKHCSLVVTPDTAVTHIASSFNIPSFVIFPPNDRDHWPEYAACDTWGGLSDCTTSFRLDDNDLTINQDGYASCRPGANADYSSELLVESLTHFMSNQIKKTNYE